MKARRRRLIKLIEQDVRLFNRKRPLAAACFLEEASLSGRDLRGIDFSGAELTSASLSNCILEGADLMSAHLNGADLRGAQLKGADFLGTELWSADLSGTDLTETNVEGARGFWAANVSDCRLTTQQQDIYLSGLLASWDKRAKQTDED